MNTYLELSAYRTEADSGFNGQIARLGGVMCGVVEVPGYNVLGQVNRTHFAVVYQAPQELSLEVWT